MMHNVIIRPAVMSERQALEALQRRASLNNPGDRDALLTNPDAIEIPPDQIAAGHVFIADRDGAIVGFSAVLPRDGPEMDLDRCLSSHTSGGTALDGCWSNTPLVLLARKVRLSCTWSGIRTQRSFTGSAVSRCSERFLPVLASACHSEECCNHPSHRSEGAESRLAWIFLRQPDPS
jgi:hypothetical protein